MKTKWINIDDCEGDYKVDLNKKMQKRNKKL